MLKSLRRFGGLRLLGLAALALAVPACTYNNNDDHSGPITWFVDPGFGSDAGGDGSPWYPFRTITRALNFTISGDAIALAQGTYSAATGELFPLRVKPGVLIEGDPATRGLGPVATLVSGGGVYAIGGGSQAGVSVTTAFVLGSGAELLGVEITVAVPVAGTGGVGVVFDGFSGTLSACTVTGNQASGVMVTQTASPSLSGNAITANGGSGVAVYDSASPLLRQNTLTGNALDGVTANDASVPNLGDLATAGGNTLQGNTGVGLNNASAALTPTTIPAVGNTWIASIQSADPSGHIPAGTTPGIVASAAGNNFAIAQAAANLQF